RGVARRRDLVESLLSRDHAVDRAHRPLPGAARRVRRQLRAAIRFPEDAGPRCAADRDASGRQAAGDRETVSRDRPRAHARRGRRKEAVMGKLASELELTCPYCQATIVVDLNLKRIVSHKEPDRGNKPELSDAQRILAEEAARREAMFEESFNAERTRGD